MRTECFYVIDNARADTEGYPREVGQYRSAEVALDAVKGKPGRRAYERTEENGHHHEIPISPPVPEELRA